MRKYVIGFILGAVLFSGIGVAAYVLTSSDVTFTPQNSNWQVGNVQEALNSLYISKTSDNYSETEKKIGTWVNGKPIYQKVFKFTQTEIFGNDSWTALSINGPANDFESIISADVIWSDTTYSYRQSVDVYYNYSNHTLYGMGMRGQQLSIPKNNYLILEYTKAGD